MTISWTAVCAVFLGSGLGGVCRYLIAGAIQERIAGTAFPWGTLTVNVLGCLLIGLFYGLCDRYAPQAWVSPQLSLFLTVGFCGGFTTFSTFVNENFLLFQSASIPLAIGYMLLCMLAGFIMLYVGYRLFALW